MNIREEYDLIHAIQKSLEVKMTELNTVRADLWDIAVALYKTSLVSPDDIRRWDRHAAAFASHELNGNIFVIGVADQ